MAGAGGAAQRNEQPMAFVKTTPTTKRCYSVFGLRVASRIAMPELTPVDAFDREAERLARRLTRVQRNG